MNIILYLNLQYKNGKSIKKKKEYVKNIESNRKELIINKKKKICINLLDNYL